MSGPNPKPFECPEPVFWYLVGLIASDGCLGRDGRGINVTAKERAFLAQVKTAIGSRGSISQKSSGAGRLAYQLQFKSRDLWHRLWQIGLTPKKSLTIGPLRVPDEGFSDFLRGVIDGDGNIRRWRHPTNGREQWALRIYGCSRPFLDWLRGTAKRLWRLEGAMCVERGNTQVRRHTKYTLKFGKIAAKVILAECYYPNAVALERKRKLAMKCVSVPVGWSKSKTVHDSKRWRSWSYVHVFVRPPRPRSDSGKDVDPAAGVVAEGISGGGPGWLNWQKRRT